MGIPRPWPAENASCSGLMTIPWRECGPYASETVMRSYVDEVFIDVPFDETDPQSQKVQAYRGSRRTAHTNRICSLLVLHNLRVRYVGGRIWTHWWARQRVRSHERKSSK
jgi:hypothetical protein